MSSFQSRSAALRRRPTSPCQRQLALLAMGALALGCADPTAPATPAINGASLVRQVEGKSRVFNFQLRAVEDPNIGPSAAHGHLQLKTTRLGDGSVRIAYKGTIFNPEGETFTGWTLSSSTMGRSSVAIALGEVEGINDRRIDPEDATVVSAEVAARLFGTPDSIDDPNLLVVVFFTGEHPAGAIRGERAVPAVQ